MGLSIDAYWSLSGNIEHVDYGIPLQVDEYGRVAPIFLEWNRTLTFTSDDTIQATRALLRDGPRNFKPWSDDAYDTWARIFSLNFPAHERKVVTPSMDYTHTSPLYMANHPPRVES
ncbi:hypothetical protein AVEN_107341-1 [Araneus ventricosus]|uniref:Uncharacterized protein n=1 Tax=Araneus ventricosus TaxID=182803 RepID=A0A4Y2HQV4_ARAVE|nr:hypothetical protein AVEN_107341-1 [Araneus ventricosus]